MTMLAPSRLRRVPSPRILGGHALSMSRMGMLVCPAHRWHGKGRRWVRGIRFRPTETHQAVLHPFIGVPPPLPGSAGAMLAVGVGGSVTRVHEPRCRVGSLQGMVKRLSHPPAGDSLVVEAWDEERSVASHLCCYFNVWLHALSAGIWCVSLPRCFATWVASHGFPFWYPHSQPNRALCCRPAGSDGGGRPLGFPNPHVGESCSRGTFRVQHTTPLFSHRGAGRDGRPPLYPWIRSRGAWVCSAGVHDAARVSAFVAVALGRAVWVLPPLPRPPPQRIPPPLTAVLLDTRVPRWPP